MRQRLGRDRCLVLRYDGDGGARDTWRFDSGYPDSAIAFVVDDHGPNPVAIYITVYANGNLYIAKLDGGTPGRVLWSTYHDFGGDDRPADIALQHQPDGQWGVVVTGSAQITDRGYDYLTTSHRPNGDRFWTKVYPGTHAPLPVMDDFATAVACDNQGRVYVTGRINQDSVTKYKFLTVRYNADGNNEVFNVYDGMYDEMYLDGTVDIAVDFEGGGFAYVTGTVEEHVGGPNPHEYLKALVIKYTKNSLIVDSHAEFGDDAHDVEAAELVSRPMASGQPRGVCLLVKRAELDSEVVTMTTVMYKLRGPTATSTRSGLGTGTWATTRT